MHLFAAQGNIGKNLQSYQYCAPGRKNTTHATGDTADDGGGDALVIKNVGSNTQWEEANGHHIITYTKSTTDRL